MSNPAVGELMDVFWDAVILGTKNPLVVEVRSKADEALGELVPMPTWAWAESVISNVIRSVSFFILKVQGMLYFYPYFFFLGCKCYSFLYFKHLGLISRYEIGIVMFLDYQAYPLLIQKIELILLTLIKFKNEK